MRSVAFPKAVRILGFLAVVIEVCAVVVLLVESGLTWLPLELLLGGGVAAVVALVLASRAEPPGAGKRPAIIALILMAAFLGLFALWVFVATVFHSGG